MWRIGCRALRARQCWRGESADDGTIERAAVQVHVVPR
jgi:hypothetical protein